MENPNQTEPANGVDLQQPCSPRSSAFFASDVGDAVGGVLWASRPYLPNSREFLGAVIAELKAAMPPEETFEENAENHSPQINSNQH